MAYARKLPSGRWQGIAKVGRVVVGRKTFDLKREALAWATATQSRAVGGVDVRAAQQTVQDVLPEWVEVRQVRRAMKTSRVDADLVRLMSPILGATPLAAVTSAACEDWFDYLVEAFGLSHASVKRYRLSLSAFFGWAVKRGVLSVNPVANATLPTQNEPDEDEDVQALMESELVALVEGIREDEPWAAPIVLILGTIGVRWGEARELRVSDVNLGQGWVRVSRQQTEGGGVTPTKGRNNRTVPFGQWLRPAFESQMRGKEPGDLLFKGPRGGQLWGSSFRRVLKWSERTHITIHGLRHTAACTWLRRGINVHDVKSWMGHKDIRTTNLYVNHVFGTMSDGARSKLDLHPGGAQGVHA